MRPLLLRTCAAVGIVAGGIAVAAGPADAATAPASPWLQSGFNAANSNANLDETTVSPGNVASLTKTLTLNAGSGDAGFCSDQIETPVFSDSRVYAVVDNYLVARDVATGATVFRHKLGSPGSVDVESIAVTHGVVILAETTDCGDDHAAYYPETYNSQTGRPAWSPQGVDALWGMTVSGKYLVQVDGEYDSPDGEVVVDNLYNGKKVWTGRYYASQSPILVEDGKVLVTGRNSVRALTLSTGAVQWRNKQLDGVVSGDTDKRDGTTLIATDEQGEADVNPANGKVRFTLPAGSGATSVTPHAIYTACGSAQLCAVRTSDGSTMWKVTTTAATNSIVYADNLLYLSSGDVVNARTGASVTTLHGDPVLVGSGHVGIYPTGTATPSFRVLSLTN